MSKRREKLVNYQVAEILLTQRKVRMQVYLEFTSPLGSSSQVSVSSRDLYTATKQSSPTTETFTISYDLLC